MSSRTGLEFETDFDDAEAQAFFDTFGEKYMKKIHRKALRKVCYDVRTAARALAPEDTSALVDSMVVRRPQDKKAKRGQTVLGVVIHEEKLKAKSEQDYAYHAVVEYGNKYRAADPFLRPAADQMRAHARQILRRESIRILTEEKPPKKKAKK
jgi:HK97 gp10 family phage protein